MTFAIKPGTRLYRFRNLTPANFGAPFGHAWVDSPTQVESRFHLPFLPDTALKGVFRSHSEGQEHTADARRYFGGSDEDAEQNEQVKKKALRFGEPGKLVFGNSELVAFPCRFSSGEKLTVAVLHNILDLIRHCGFSGFSPDVLSLIESFLYSRDDLFLLHGNIDGFDQRDFSVFSDSTDNETTGELLRFVGNFIGMGHDLHRPVALAAFEGARKLWGNASEIRTLTQIDVRGTAKDFSLRTVELIPAGSVFACSISNLGKDEYRLDIGSGFQMGAWENIGFGWFQAEPVEFETTPENAEFSKSSCKLAHLDTYRTMIEAHCAIDCLNAEDEASKKIKSAISRFGFRLKAFGAEAALAFELAKAKPMKAKFGAETFAHRWLLFHLLKLPGPAPEKTGPCEALKSNGDRPWFEKSISDMEIFQIENRWLWLRKYAELALIEERS